MIDRVDKYLSDHIFKRLLILLFSLNALDAFATLYWVTNGIATEANPIMAEWLNLGALPFVAAKISLVSIGIYFLWLFRSLRLSKISVLPVLALYLLVTVMHSLIAYDTFFKGFL